MLIPSRLRCMDIRPPDPIVWGRISAGGKTFMQAHQASHWDDTLSILQTELKGQVTREDVERWKRTRSFQSVRTHIPVKSQRRLQVFSHGTWPWGPALSRIFTAVINP